jgi:hypothetical protein
MPDTFAPIVWQKITETHFNKETTMAHKLPLYVRQHYTSKPTTSGDGWVLKCDTCGETKNLLKPPPGQSIEEHGIRMLMTHTQTHLTPKGHKLYTVAHIGDEVKAQTTPYIHPERQVDTVYEVPGGHMVHTYAANQKHATIRAHGIMRAHFNPANRNRHNWRNNPR